MMELLTLCYEFFKTGLFAVGGGLATLPFIYEMAQAHPTWMTESMIADMLAISQSMPGPIGINMATYVGYQVGAYLGGPLAVLSLTLPALIIDVIIMKAFEKFKKNRYIQSVLDALHPAVAGLIAAAGFTVWKLALLTKTELSSMGELLTSINLPAVLLFAALFALTQIKKTSKIHPIAFIAVAAAAGIILKF